MDCGQGIARMGVFMKVMMNRPNKYADGVFEGGGVKGIGLVGAVAYAEEIGYQWERLAGTSAGAIVACLLAAGYTALEIKDSLMELDYGIFKDPTLGVKVPVISSMIGLVFFKGLFRGKRVETWLRDLLMRKGIRTFGDLYRKEDQAEASRLQVIASDLSRGRMLVLPDDLVDYGYKPWQFEVASAVRMSMSIPYFFQPVVLPCHQVRSTGKSYIVDGGLLSNYPIWLFDSKETPRWPTFGFRLVEPDYFEPHEIKGPISLFGAMVSTILEAHDERHIKDSNFDRTIPIPTLGTKTTEFDLNFQRRQALFDAGYESARAFFSQWRWHNYVTQHTRIWRDQKIEIMKRRAKDN